MSTFETEEILSGIRRWVEQETPTDNPEAVSRLSAEIAEDYRALGCKTKRISGRDGFGDHLLVDGPWGGDGPGILVLCHLDTVHPMGTIEKDLPWREDGDVVYGPGIHDMKGSAYLSYRAFRHLAETGERTPLPIRFLYSSDEEVGSPTSRDLIEEAGRNAKYVLVTEPARDGGKIVVQRKGTARFKLRTRGRPSHAGAYHQDGRSAILEMARQIIAIEALTDYDAGLTVNIGTVSGGTRPNVVPEHCVVEIDMRMPSLAVGQAAIAKLEAMTPHDPDVTLTLEGEIDRPPMERSEGVEKLFQHARKCAADLGIALEGVYTGGGSDGNFTAALGIPTLDGLGADGRGAHTMEEQIYKSSLVPRTELMLSLFRTLT